MLDFLSHNEAPISDAQWDAVDRTIVEVARRQLVGRRFLPIYGPLGAGTQFVTLDKFESPTTTRADASVDALGEDATNSPVASTSRMNVQMPLIYKDFILYWRDIESSRKFGHPLDLSPAAVAASICAQAEDDMIFHGVKDEGTGQSLPGLLNVEGRQQLKAGQWASEGGIFQDVLKATSVLNSQGFFAPYAMVVPPTVYSQLHRYVLNSGTMEIDQIKQLVTQGVYLSSVMPNDKVLVVSTGMQNMDLAIGQDFKTGYLGAQNMNHPFRVFETAVLRIKRPGAVCVLEQ
jgi:uncharacterized linocin/CFP29 family protein